MESREGRVLLKHNLSPFRQALNETERLRVYSDWTRQLIIDGVKHDALVLEHYVSQSEHSDQPPHGAATAA